MGKAALYNDEKVLFFAEREEGLHVAKDEAKRVTDLHIIRQRLTGARMIKKVASDDSGNYYRTTTKGTKRLLELQIAWRTSNGKDVSLVAAFGSPVASFLFKLLADLLKSRAMLRNIEG